MSQDNALRKEIIRLIREDFDPTPSNWEDREWNDNAEDVADDIIALARLKAARVPEGLRNYVSDALEHAKQRFAQNGQIGTPEWWRGHRDALSEVLAKIDHANRPILASEPAATPAPAQASPDALRARRRALMEAKIIVETEEELDGDPPFPMSQESQHVARAIVRATKKSIADRIDAALNPTGEA